MSGSRLPEQTHLGVIYLRVSDLERSLAFYRDVLGMRVLPREAGVAQLSAKPDGPPLLELIEHSGAPPRPAGMPGLYHLALLYPERLDLARAVHRLLESRWQIQGASDHSVSEAVYLADPDGNGVELYVDRPADLWRWEAGQVMMRTMPLDLPGLLIDFRDELDSWPGMPAGTVIGHIHLHVSNLERAESFYGDLLGFEVTTRAYPGALFLAAGGYHHHIGLNTWAGMGPVRSPEEIPGLLAFEVVIPDPSLIAQICQNAGRRGIEHMQTRAGCRLRDQDGNGVILRGS